MENVVIVSAVRTPIGKFGGTLTNIDAVELGKIVISESINRCNLDPSQIDEVIMGCVLQTGLGQNVARQSAVNAGIPHSIPALTINNVCGSSLKAVNLATAMIQSRTADVMIAGGMENMSASMYALPNARFGYRMNDTTVVDTMIKDALTDSFENYHMGITAENIAHQFSISREMQDEFASKSQQKCESAQNLGIFNDEIVPVEVPTKKGYIQFDSDEFPRQNVSIDSLRKLKPVFKINGTVTAGNSSGINDGAAAIALMSERKAMELGIKPIAKIIAIASAGVDPKVMGLGPAFSTKKALNQIGLTIDQMDLIEANEAFAAQALADGMLLNWDDSKVNVNGGAIALGHPVGASGCRILVSLIYEMKRRSLKYGLATLCVGGGMGVTTIIEM